MVLSSENRTLLSASHEGTVIVWDYEQAAELACFPCSGPVSTLAISPDRATMATGCGTKLQVWSFLFKREMLAFKGLKSQVRTMSINEKSTMIAVAAENGYVQVWNTQTGA